MDSSNKIRQYLHGLGNVLENLDVQEIEKAAELMHDAYINGRQIFMFGNGGSGSTASHLACDLNKGCCMGLEKRFKVLCLNDNLPTLMAYSNDVGYEVVFIEQLKNFLKEGDLVIGFSGSGNSENVIQAMQYAKENGAVTLGFTGYRGGKLKKLADYSVNADIDDMQQSEDVHIIVSHILMQVLCEKLGVKYC